MLERYVYVKSMYPEGCVGEGKIISFSELQKLKEHILLLLEALFKKEYEATGANLGNEYLRYHKTSINDSGAKVTNSYNIARNIDKEVRAGKTIDIKLEPTKLALKQQKTKNLNSSSKLKLELRPFSRERVVSRMQLNNEYIKFLLRDLSAKEFGSVDGLVDELAKTIDQMFKDCGQTLYPIFINTMRVGLSPHILTEYDKDKRLGLVFNLIKNNVQPHSMYFNSEFFAIGFSLDPNTDCADVILPLKIGTFASYSGKEGKVSVSIAGLGSIDPNLSQDELSNRTKNRLEHLLTT